MAKTSTTSIPQLLLPSEAEVKRAVCAWLTLNLYHWIRIQSGNLFLTYRNTKGHERGRAVQCAQPGTADLLVILPPNGYALWLEIKSRRKGSKQSPEQVEFAEKMARLGAGYRVVRHVDELPTFMREELENAKVRRA